MSDLKVARAWAIKEMAMSLWGCARRGWAVRMWRKWHAWAVRSRPPAMQRAARMIKRHRHGGINAAANVTNAVAESVNSKMQRIKRMACNRRERFRHAVYFHLGELDLCPETPACHTKD